MSKDALVRDTTIKILSVIFAVLLWFYVITEQNPVVTKDITLPVKILNLEAVNRSELVLLEDPNSFNITLRLKGKKEVLDSVNQSTLNAYANIGNYIARGENVVPVTVNGIPNGVSITTRSEQGIKVNLDKRMVVQRAVAANITGNPVGGLANLTPILTPSEVVLTGAESIINKVKTIRVDIDIAGADTNVSKSLPVRLLDEAGNVVAGILLDTPNINVVVPISNTKRVPIQLMLEGQPAEGYMVANEEILPKEILVTGEQLALDSLTVLNTSPVNISNLTADIELPVTLQLPVGVKLVNQEELIHVALNIQKVETGSIEVNAVEFRNLNEKYVVNDSPLRTIKVVAKGPEELMQDLESYITLYVDLADAKEGIESYEIKCMKPPALEILEISPLHIGLDIKSRE